jgi:hypothetical protein
VLRVLSVPRVAERPYEPPEYEADARPAVIVWYRIYAAFMTLAALAGLGVTIVLARATADPEVAVRPGAADAQVFVLLSLLLSVSLAIFYAVATFVPYRPWGWTVGIIAIGLGLTSAMVIFAIPLLVHWLKPITRAAFGRM